MNKVFKVIWNEARNAYVVVSEIAKNHGSKSCSTKKLLAMLIATGVMTCASLDVLAAEPTAAATAKSQYVAFATTTSSFPDEYEQTINGHKYIYDVANQYWVREGYILVLEQNAKLHTPLSTNGRAADVAYTGGGDTSSILQSVTSLVSASGTVTNMGESLNSINASAYAGVSHSGGTKVAGTWNYIIEDSSWKDSVAPGNYKYGYVDLVDSKLPKGFKTAEDPNTELTWDDTKQCYTYKGNPVDYSNVYVIDGKIGVFTNKDGSKVYTGNVFGKNNEVLMTVKDANNKFYSYWASEVTDPSATMQSYRMADYEKDLSVLLENEKKLYRNDIKEVTLTKDENSATIGLLRNGDTDAGAPVKGAITVTSGGGTGGSGAANDTFVKISNGTAEQTFATGSKVEAIGNKDATTGIKINGEAYTIKSGSVVSVKQNAAEKTTTITVDGKDTTITDTDTHNALDSAKLDGKKLTITGKDGDTASVDLSSIDTDTKYTAGNGIAISEENAISVKLKEGENNLEVTAGGLALKKQLTGMESITGAGGSISFNGSNVKVNQNTFNKDGRIQNVAAGTETKDAVNFGQLDATNKKVDNLTTEVGKGWTVETENGTATKVGAGDTVKFSGADDNIKVSNDGTNVSVKLNKNLTGLTSVTTKNAYVTEVNEGDKTSVTNVKFVEDKIAGVTLTEGNGISITDKKINVKLKDGEQNLVVNDKGLAMNTALTGIQSITGAGGTINLAGSAITINETTFNKDGRIQNVAAGTETKDAVNLGQLKDVKAEAGKHTTLVAGDNVQVKEEKTDNGLKYTVSATDTTYTAGNGIAINGENHAISVKLKAGEGNLVVDKEGNH